jgi:hypothetical protein
MKPGGITSQQLLLGKRDSEQARAKQDKTANGHSEETVRSEFFTHGTYLPIGHLIANKSNITRLSSAVAAASRLPLRQGVENIKRQLFDFGPPLNSVLEFEHIERVAAGRAATFPSLARAQVAAPKPRYALFNQM